MSDDIRGFRLLSLCMVLCLPLAAARADMGEPVNADWQSHELTFNFSSFNTWYNCQSFEDRLTDILRQLGAREDVKVRTSGCYGSRDLGNMLTSRITVHLPMTGQATATGFMAGYRTVKLRGDQRTSTGLGDCEMLEQIQRQLLPKLGLQNEGATLHCFPGNAINAGQSLEVRALMAMPKGNGKQIAE